VRVQSNCYSRASNDYRTSDKGGTQVRGKGKNSSLLRDGMRFAFVNHDIR